MGVKIVVVERHHVLVRRLGIEVNHRRHLGSQAPAAAQHQFPQARRPLHQRIAHIHAGFDAEERTRVDARGKNGVEAGARLDLQLRAAQRHFQVVFHVARKGVQERNVAVGTLAERGGGTRRGRQRRVEDLATADVALALPLEACQHPVGHGAVFPDLVRGQLGLRVDRTAEHLHVGVVLGRREKGLIFTVVHRRGRRRAAGGSLVHPAAGELVCDAAGHHVFHIGDPGLVENPASVHAQAQAAVARLRKLVQFEVRIAGIGGVRPVAAQLGVDGQSVANVARPARLKIDPLVGRSGRADVAGRMGVIGVEVEHAAFLPEGEAFAERHLLELRIGFKPDLPGRHAGLGLDHHGPGSQVTVDHGRDAADHFHRLDVVGRDLPGVHAAARRGGDVALPFAHRRARREHL